jgi:hypothetical protein
LDLKGILKLPVYTVPASNTITSPGADDVRADENCAAVCAAHVVPPVGNEYVVLIVICGRVGTGFCAHRDPTNNRSINNLFKTLSKMFHHRKLEDYMHQMLWVQLKRY